MRTIATTRVNIHCTCAFSIFNITIRTVLQNSKEGCPGYGNTAENVEQKLASALEILDQKEEGLVQQWEQARAKNCSRDA